MSSRSERAALERLEGVLDDLESEYEEAVQHAMAHVGVIREFHELYPDAIGFISYYTGLVNHPKWNSQAFRYGRYVLTMQLPVTLSDDGRRVAAAGEPTFDLLEVVRVEDLGRGRVSVHFGDSWRFGQSRWRELRQAKGKIEEVFTERTPDPPGATVPADREPFVGIRVDDPVPSFEIYARSERGEHRGPKKATADRNEPEPKD